MDPDRLPPTPPFASEVVAVNAAETKKDTVTIDASHSGNDLHPEPAESSASEESNNDDQPWDSQVRYRAQYLFDDGDEEGRELPLVNSSVARSDDQETRGVLEVVYCYRCAARRFWSSKKVKDGAIPKGAVKTDRCKIRIHSPKLINALRAVVSYYPGQDLLGDTVEFLNPFRFIFHHRAQLEEYKSNHPKQHSESYRAECNQHIDVLLSEFEKLEGKRASKEAERHSREVATFENLWMLYKPGEKVFVTEPEPGKTWSAVLSDISGGLVDGSNRKYRISVWHIRNFGTVFGRCRHTFWIAPFEGERDIMSLRVYPQQHHRDTDEDLAQRGGRTLAQQMEVWGAKYWELRKPTLQEFSGNCILPETLPRIEGRVMVDFQAFYTDGLRVGTQWRPVIYRSRGPRDPPSSSSDSDSDIDLPVSDARLSRSRRTRMLSKRRTREDMINRGCECENCIKLESNSKRATFRHYDEVDPKGPPPGDQNHFFSLCEREICAFALKERSFVVIDIDGLHAPVFDKELINYLVLPKDIKIPLRTLALSSDSKPNGHGGGTAFKADFIRGKGEGQVFLIHGKPGVGKTCAAECIAELAHRPLLSVTSGDLGTTAAEFDRNLSTFFRLGESWGALVLIDEADIYFEQRTRNELERNGLVSVLLRALEYYRGTLFLTTNRIGVIDEAFMSRIHVSFGFPDLTDEDRERIWVNNFERLKATTNIKVSPSALTYVKTAAVTKLKWNGRHIRNAFQTAVAFAEAEGVRSGEEPTITQEHIESVVSLSKEFQKYMFKVHRDRTDEHRARDMGWRADDSGPEPEGEPA